MERFNGRQESGMTLDQAQAKADEWSKKESVESAKPVRIISNQEIDPVIDGDTGWDVEIAFK